MPASENPIVGANVLLKAGAVLVGGQTGATLTHTANALDLAVKGQGLWGDQLDGEHEFSISLPALETESDGTHRVGADGTVSITVDDGTGAVTVPGLSELTVTLSNEFDDRAGLDDPLWRQIAVVGKSMEASLTGDWYDPNATSGAAYAMLDALIDPSTATDTLEIVFSFGSFQLSGSVRASDMELDFPGAGEGLTQASFTLGNSGAMAAGGAAIDSGLQALVDAYFNETQVSALIEQQDGAGAELDGATGFSGNALVEQIEMSASRAEALTISTDLVGDGALTTLDQVVP
jgi:hypothetical protein